MANTSSSQTDYILFKVTNVLPFLSINLSLGTLLFNVILSVYSYILYGWMIYSILKYKNDLLDLNTTFCNTVIVRSFADFFSHIQSFIFGVLSFYPPIAEVFKAYSTPDYTWTAYYAFMHFFPFCQFFLGAYVAFQRFVLIAFPFNGADFLAKTFYPCLLIMIITSATPTWYLWAAKTFCDKIPPFFTNGEYVATLNYKTEKWMTNNRNSRNSIIHYSIFITLSFAFNIFSSVKMICYNKRNGYINKNQSKINLNMLFYSIITTFFQILFVAINFVWYFDSRLLNDASFFYLCKSLRIYVMHLNCLLQPYYFFLLSKNFRGICYKTFSCRAKDKRESLISLRNKSAKVQTLKKSVV
uniref:Serpentine receptor class gamma n=1 Tax=Parastrongyloides trichosuri TaxID=131310 RepID=A0A0N4Z426_PARTI